MQSVKELGKGVPSFLLQKRGEKGPWEEFGWSFFVLPLVQVRVLSSETTRQWALFLGSVPKDAQLGRS